MTIIPLRAYNREIEGIIDNGQLDEAVAHCRHILTTFPKHIATYRLLGKAHLEQQRISDATDIFQRVLSAIPDDFISNVGMSIIREDENNLDASLWHMELAYEAQPSNTAIQDELRRLYGRRDGMQPSKLRLTRGALARMYAKGGLLDQAVAELRSAIAEEPNRYDLQLLLAGLYFQTAQRVEAVDACVNILKKLPFCLAANQILAVTFPDSEISGKNYRQIAISMDPYYSHATNDAITSDLVPDNAINIERLEWKSGIHTNDVVAQPSWAVSLGVSLENKSEEKLPEWLKGTEAPVSAEPVESMAPSVSPFIWDTQEVEKIITEDVKPESEIPDWMKDAGWNPASGDTSQKSSGAFIESEVSEIQPQAELEKADIPDWLRGIAPEGALEEETLPPPKQDDNVPIPWLEKQQPGPTDSIIQWLEDAKPETPKSPAKQVDIPLEIGDEEIPDWLKDLDLPYPTPEQEGLSIAEAAVLSSVIPALINDDKVTEPSKQPDVTLPPPQESLLVSESIEPVSETVVVPPSTEIIGPEEVLGGETDEIPDWIKELAGETPEVTPSDTLIDDQKIELVGLSEEEQIVEIPQPSQEVQVKEAFEIKEGIVEQPITFVAEERIEEVAPEEESHPEKITLPSDELPIASLPLVIDEQARIEEKIASDGGKSEDDSGGAKEIAALAWLTSLVIQDGDQEEAVQATPVEEPSATPLEWVKLEEDGVIESTTPEVTPQEDIPAIPADEVPDWLTGLGEPSGFEETTLETVSEISSEEKIPHAEELPAWLIAAGIAEDKVSPSESAQETTGIEEAELPDWIKELTEATPSREIPIVSDQTPIEELPISPSEPFVESVPVEVPVSEIIEESELEIEQQVPASIAEEEISAQPLVIEPSETKPELATLYEAPVELAIDSPAVKLYSLEEARTAINQGSPSQAAEIYTGLIKNNLHLGDVIKDIQEALYRYPVDVNLWMSLGDAQLRTDDLQEALNAYIKAEDLIR